MKGDKRVQLSWVKEAASYISGVALHLTLVLSTRVVWQLRGFFRLIFIRKWFPRRDTQPGCVEC